MDLVPWRDSRDIATSAFGPLTTIVKGKPGSVDESLARLSKKYGVSEEAVALQWCIDHGVAAITTSYKEERLKGYMGVTCFELTREDVKEISEKTKEKHLRTNNLMQEWDLEDKR